MAQLLGRLDGAGLLRRHVPSAAPVAAEPAIDRDTIVREIFDRHAEAQDAAEQDRGRPHGSHPAPKVFPWPSTWARRPVWAWWWPTPEGATTAGRLTTSTTSARTGSGATTASTEFTERARHLPVLELPVVARALHRGVSKRVKERSPYSITVHGGPDTPKYEADTAAYFARPPPCRRGRSVVRARSTAAGRLAALRVGDRRRSTPICRCSPASPASPIATATGSCAPANATGSSTLDTLPSPFLTGLFDVFTGRARAVRDARDQPGLPVRLHLLRLGFGHQQPHPPVRHSTGSTPSSTGAPTPRWSRSSVADANFGIFARDVEHRREGRRAAHARSGHPQCLRRELRQEHGEAPPAHHHGAGRRRHHGPGRAVAADDGLRPRSTPSTARTSRPRSTTQLADEMRRAQLPLMVELMMGLPGQTLAVVRRRPPAVHRPRGPVPGQSHAAAGEQPDERSRTTGPNNEIQTSDVVGPGLNAMVIATRSFTAEDYGEMERLRVASLVYERLRRAATAVALRSPGDRDPRDGLLPAPPRRGGRAAPSGWPSLAAQIEYGAAMMAPPYSWSLLMADLGDLVTHRVGGHRCGCPRGGPGRQARAAAGVRATVPDATRAGP